MNNAASYFSNKGSFSNFLVNALGKVSIFVLIFTCLQFTLVILMINTLLPENFYQISRAIASFVLPEIPDYEADIAFGKKSSFFQFSEVTLTDYQIDIQFRIRRYGITHAFLVNLSKPFLLVFLFVIIILLAIFLKRYFKNSDNKARFEAWQRNHRILKKIILQIYEGCFFYFILTLFLNL
jgi:hypothetical protein